MVYIVRLTKAFTFLYRHLEYTLSFILLGLPAFSFCFFWFVLIFLDFFDSQCFLTRLLYTKLKIKFRIRSFLLFSCSRYASCVGIQHCHQIEESSDAQHLSEASFAIAFYIIFAVSIALAGAVVMLLFQMQKLKKSLKKNLNHISEEGKPMV